MCLLQFPLTSSLPCNYEKRLGKWARLKNLIRAGFGLDWNPPRNKDVSVEGTIFVFDKHFLCISLCYKDNHKLQRFDLTILFNARNSVSLVVTKNVIFQCRQNKRRKKIFALKSKKCFNFEIEAYKHRANVVFNRKIKALN